MSNVFITGGSRGIGRAIVLRFVQEGWGVGFSYSSNKEAADETIKMAKAVNPHIMVRAYNLKLQNEEEIEVICERVISEFSDVTAVVNNAAIVKDTAAALMSNEDWHEVIAVNLTAPFLVSRSFLLHFLSNRKGRFVHLSSLSAYGSSGQINYAAAKSGLQGMSMTLAKEYGKKGITSNIVIVGYVPTSLTEENMNEELRKYWVQHCPAGRVGTSDEIASAVYYLSSDETGFISAETLRVTAGFTYAP